MSGDPKINLEWTDEGRKFRIVRFIDEGGMGEVYEGTLTEGTQAQRVAIKILHKRRKKTTGTASDPQNLEKRFHREIEILQRFDSPNIVKVVGSGYDDAVGHYYAMEYIPDGKTLANTTEDGRVSLDQGELYLRHTLEALKLFAADNLIHRDIKPQNIMIHVFVAKVADFGLGKLLGSDLSEITTTGTSMGTPSCMSPEQVMGGRDITPKCDIYSTGATFFQVLLGENLFPDPTIPVEMATAHINQTPKWPTERGVELPAKLEDLLAMMVEKDPDLRPSAEQALAMLDEPEPNAAKREKAQGEIRALESRLWKRLNLSNSGELAQILDQDKSRVKAERASIQDDKLVALADLHEQAGLHTPRDEPSSVRRYDHFLLSAFYREEAGKQEPDHMVPKRAALEKRRLEMIDRRVEDTQTKLAAAEGAEADKLTGELGKLRQLQKPADAPPESAATPSGGGKSNAPLVVVALVLIVLVGVGGLFLMSNAKVAALRAELKDAKSLIESKDFSKADAGLRKAADLSKDGMILTGIDDENAELKSLSKLVGEGALSQAGASLDAAERKLKALVDPTREGAADTAELVGQALDRARSALDLAEGNKADTTELSTREKALRSEYEKQKSKIPNP